MAHHLLFHGTLLFLVGLVNGAVIPLFLNKRMGLSAHLAGVQNGLALIAFGLIWPHSAVPLAGIAYWSALFSMYGIWFGLVLAGIWGTSRSTPIAGRGYSASSWKENLVSMIIRSGSVAAILATSLLLVGLYKNLDGFFRGLLLKPPPSASYRVVAYDQPAHGESDGKTTNVLEIAPTMELVAKQSGNFDTIIAYSIGTIITSYALVKRKFPLPSKLVCLALSTS